MHRHLSFCWILITTLWGKSEDDYLAFLARWEGGGPLGPSYLMAEPERGLESFASPSDSFHSILRCFPSWLSILRLKKKKIIYRVDLSKTVILNLFGAVSSFVHGLLWNWLKSFGSFSKKKHKHVPSLHFSATRDSNRADSDLGPKRTRFLLWKSRPFWRFLMMPEGSIFKVCQKRWLSTVRSVRGHSALPHLWSLLYITLILMCNVVLSSDSRRFRPHRPAPHPQKACACPGLCGEFGELSW